MALYITTLRCPRHSDRVRVNKMQCEPRSHREVTTAVDQESARSCLQRRDRVAPFPVLPLNRIWYSA